jgi:hypothetical protein
MTHAPMLGSPCVDAGSNPANLTFDQRGPGFPRVLNGTADMGAYEGIDPAPVVASVSIPATITTAGGTNCFVIVRYEDDTGIDVATIDLNDIAVTGPGYAAPQTPTARSIAGSGQVVTVTYTLPAPGGPFDHLDDSQYSVAMIGNQVGDSDLPVQHFVAAAPLGTFWVNVPIPGPLVEDEPSDIDDVNLAQGHLSLREALRLANAAAPTVLSAGITGGLAGGNNTTNVFRLLGDVNGDKAINGLDLTAFRNAFGTHSTDAGYVSALDFNGDGAIDGTDLTQFRNRFGVILP